MGDKILKKITVSRANDLPEDIQKENNVFGDTLVEIRFFSGSPLMEENVSVEPIKCRFSHRLRQLLDESKLLI